MSATLRTTTIALAGGANGFARRYAPFPVQPGFSIVHFDPIASLNLLMEASGPVPGVSHAVEPPNDLSLPLLRDIGWFPDRDLDGVAAALDTRVEWPRSRCRALGARAVNCTSADGLATSMFTTHGGAMTAEITLRGLTIADPLEPPLTITITDPPGFTRHTGSTTSCTVSRHAMNCHGRPQTVGMPPVDGELAPAGPHDCSAKHG